jgi:hypothetical protein
MKKYLIFTLIGVAIIGALITVLIYLQKKGEKSLSPEDQVTFNQGDVKISVFYNRPYKKNREIFGGLVPYDKVWRTGANEATTFETNKDLLISGKSLKAGKYSLWTIPGKDTWKIIFNSEHGQWGINSKGQANRSPSLDALTIEVTPVEQEQVFEQFTIAFEKAGDETEMVLAWDKTLVSVPITL